MNTCDRKDNYMPYKNFLQMDYSDALKVISSYEEHKRTAHLDQPAGFKCPKDIIVETLLAVPWPDLDDSYYQGLFDMCVAVNLMWDEAQQQAPLMRLGIDVNHNLTGMLAAVALKWKEVREKAGAGEVREFDGIEEI